MSLDLITRPAISGDLPTITEFTRQLWFEHAEHASDLQNLAAIQAYDFAAHVTESFHSPTEQWFVATVNDSVVGAVRTEQETHRNPLYTHDKLLLIDDISVAPDMRRMGVAKELVLACCGYADERGIGLLQAMIYDWNGPSVGLFTVLGFNRRRSDYFLAQPLKG